MNRNRLKEAIQCSLSNYKLIEGIDEYAIQAIFKQCNEVYDAAIVAQRNVGEALFELERLIKKYGRDDKEAANYVKKAMNLYLKIFEKGNDFKDMKYYINSFENYLKKNYNFLY